MKREVDVYDHVNDILKRLKKGILITTKVDDRVNSMAIAWGQIGVEWERMIFTTFIRTGRFTHQMLEKSNEFTVNIPMDDNAGKIIGFCGTKSGRDHDKAKALGLTLVESDHVDVPGIKEVPLTLECRVVYSQLQDNALIPDDFRAKYYPQDVDSSHFGINKDSHTMFMGEILGAYIAE